jgi:hypothetical protein
MKTELILIAFAATLVSPCISQETKPETLKTRIGELTFTHDFANGYPDKKSVEKLYDEMDFQRGCQLTSGRSHSFPSRSGRRRTR